MNYIDLITLWSSISEKFKVDSITIVEILKLIEDKHLTLSNEYQRESNVWSNSDKIDLLKTLHEGYPIPPIYLYLEDNEKTFSVLDGLQRLSALNEYSKNRTAFSKADPLKNGEWDAVKNMAIPIVLFKGDKNEKIYLFDKINTSGSKANNQELRRSSFHDSQIRNWINQNGEKVETLEELLLNMGTFSKSQIIRQQAQEYIMWLLIILRWNNDIAKLINTEKNQLDDFYKNNEIPNDDEWKTIINRISTIKEALENSDLSKYKSKIKSKAYLFNLFFLIEEGIVFTYETTSSEIAAILSRTFKYMTDIQDNTKTNERPFDRYSIARTTIAKDRNKSLDWLKHYIDKSA